MTIEEGLDELEEGKKPDENLDEKPAESTPKNENTLYEDGKEIMGNCLVKYFEGELPNQSEKFSIPEYLKKVIKNGSFELFSVEPSVERITAPTVKLITRWGRELQQEEIKAILTGIFGEYVLKTDLISYTTPDTRHVLKSKVPEYKKVIEDLVPSKVSRTTLHPHLLVLGMDTKHIPFAAIAVQKALDAGAGIIPQITFNKRVKRNMLRGILDSMKIPTEFYIKTAQEYNIEGKVMETLSHLESVFQNYITSWGIDE